MIAEELVKERGAFVGANGEVRHVIILHKLGRGWGVTWDSIPRAHPDYYRDLFDREKNQRPRGYMPMRAFQKWAVDLYKSPAQEPGAQQGQSSAREGAERSGNEK